MRLNWQKIIGCFITHIIRIVLRTQQKRTSKAQSDNKLAY